MRALVLCDDYWHHADVVRAGLAAVTGMDIEFTIIEDGRDWSADLMSEYPVTLLVKSNNVTADDQSPWVTDAVQQAFVDYVEGGKGLLAVHSGTASYAEMPVIRGLLGGVFTHHPKQCPVTVTPVGESVFTQGVEPFTLQDEHYHMAKDDEAAEVFATSTSEHGTQPAGWWRTQGQGRVCVLTPGHTTEVWVHPSFQALLKNAITWCAG